MLHGAIEDLLALLLGDGGREGSVGAVALLSEEGGLQVAPEVFGHGLLGVLLHAGVDGGVDLKSIGVEVVGFAVGLLVFVAPAIEWVCLPSQGVVEELLGLPFGVVAPVGLFGHEGEAEVLAEVGRGAVGVVRLCVMQDDGEGAERVAGCLCHEARFDHLAEDGVAALQGALGVAYGVVIRGVFTHADQHG